MVINALVLPFARADANAGDKGGGGLKAPVIHINVSKIESLGDSGPPARRVLEAEDAT